MAGGTRFLRCIEAHRSTRMRGSSPGPVAARAADLESPPWTSRCVPRPSDRCSPRPATALPDAESASYWFEPKWDGFRCIVFRDGDDIELGSRNERPLTRYFPELLEPLRGAARQVRGRRRDRHRRHRWGLDFDGLQNRLHPAESRVNKLAAETPASFVAFDILAIGDESLMEHAAGRATSAARTGARPGRRRPSTSRRSPPTATWPPTGSWRFEGAGLDGVIAKDPPRTYLPDKRAQLKVKHQRTADCVVAGYRVHKSGDGVGSMLLGLYDDEGQLHHVGVASSLHGRQASRAARDPEAVRGPAPSRPPWREWARPRRTRPTSAGPPGGQSRWNADKDLSWWSPSGPSSWPRSPTRTCSTVACATAHGSRTGAPTATPASCTYAQLEVVPPDGAHPGVRSRAPPADATRTVARERRPGEQVAARG